MSEYILYSTLGCHLCDQAKSIIDPVIERYKLRYTEIDIADDHQLSDVYGVLIPVFKYSYCESYLNWPFTTKELEQYLQVITRLG